MKRGTRSRLFLIAGIACLAVVQTAVAQTTATKSAVLHFSFRDSVRGTVVRPDAIMIDDKMAFNTIDDAGRVSIPVEPGDHRVVIRKEGYDVMDSRQTASLEHAPLNLVMLDPATQPEQLQPENLGEGMPLDGTVIAGFVIDESVGKPVAGAKVELVDQDVSVQSDANGFFKLPVSMPDGKQMPEDPRGVIYATRDFRVTKPGYGFEERLNVLLESGAPRIYQVALIRGGGGNSIDEAGDRNNLQSSLFGLANVEPEDEPTTQLLMRSRE